MDSLSRILAGPGIRIRVLITDSYRGQNVHGDTVIEFIRLDMQDGGSVKVAFQDTDCACIWTGIHEDIAGFDRFLVDAAQLAGVPFLVNVCDSAVWAAMESMLEQPAQNLTGHLRHGLPVRRTVTTLVYPSIYMQSIFAVASAWVPLGLWGGTAGNGRAGLVDRLDVLTATAAILRDGPERHGEKKYHLTGPAAVSLGYVADYLSQSVGHNVTYRYRTQEEQRSIYQTAGLSAQAITQILAMEKSIRLGVVDKVTGDVLTLTGRPAGSVIDWIAGHRTLFGLSPLPGSPKHASL
ncbi:hypothetical protein SJI19_08150 [Acerihabitans sp. TG2]|uniref:hypothetical protein n=1 Tax=Acerihabitans sp. TG2 TaxID=3096008 RepID=UPI002B235BC2|nr:hypothetical protein [Acerihabitans sp. TG2]MEA9390511.1 hypothetical protein [Acerihabitans sp. TG2]